MDHIRVFISYSHDSDDHRSTVAGLAARLRSDGLDVVIDQYVNGSPVEGWQKWMLNQLDEAAYVLVVCTEAYHRRFRGKETGGQGKGATYEGVVISQEIYDAYCQTLKFVPILFSQDQEPFILEPLRAYSHYNPTTTRGYQDLYDFLLGQKGLDPGEIGAPKRKARPIAEPLPLIDAPKPSSRPLANLPYHSLGPLFKGREPVLRQIRESLTNSNNDATAIVGMAVHGLGGVGKTRLAVEYAWRHANDYTGLFFVVADSPEALRRNLASLCGPTLLNLPEQALPEEEPRTLAAINWLQTYPGWLLILDNLDTMQAALAAEKLLDPLRGGHVLFTGRRSKWGNSVDELPLEVLDVADAVAFLLARTDKGRRKSPDDAAHAQELAEELGRLALALEQAGAYIAMQRLTFARYLELWRKEHDKVLDWFDEQLVKYPRSVAITWQTSFDALTEPARTLLRRLAWLGPEPIPESLLEVSVAELGVTTDVHALTNLESYSLIKRDAELPTFTVHRLVQDVTRRSLRDEPEHRHLNEALNWINNAFVGDPQDVRTWPTLEPLAPHARTIVGHADQLDIAKPTTRLMSSLALFFDGKALHSEAEPLMRRALAIDEWALGPDYPNVARDLNNLAGLLKATNRLEQAEPLMRRALAIDERSFGPDHPEVAIRLNNLARLLQETNRLEQAEPLMRRHLLIFREFTRRTGHEHPHLSAATENYAILLKAMGKTEAEILGR